MSYAWNLKISIDFYHLEVIADTLEGYDSALSHMESAYNKFVAILQNGDGETIRELRNVTTNKMDFETYRNQVNQFKNVLNSYIEEMRKYASPVSNTLTKINEDNFHYNIKYIEDQINTIRNTYDIFGNESEKAKVLIQNFRSNEVETLVTKMKRQLNELWTMHDTKIKKVFTTDEEYKNKLSDMHKQYISWWEEIIHGGAVGVTFIKDLAAGFFSNLIDLVKGVMCIVADMYLIGVDGIMFGLNACGLKPPYYDEYVKFRKEWGIRWNAGEILTALQRPDRMIEHIASGAHDKGFAYSVGYIIPEVASWFIGIGEVETALEMSRITKLLGSAEKVAELAKLVGGKTKLVKIVKSLGGAEKFVKLMEEAGGAARLIEVLDKVGDTSKFLKIIEQAGGAERFFKLVDEAGGVEKFLSAVEEAGGLEKYLDNLHPIGEGAKSHLIDTEGIVNGKVSGGHNQEKFQKFVQENKIKIVSEKPHPSIPGVKELEYQMPKLDRAGNVVDPIEYRARPYKKTVYDPSMISDDLMYQWGQEAMRSGIKDGREITGYAKNGLKFIGYLDDENNITNFFPII